MRPETAHSVAGAAPAAAPIAEAQEQPGHIFVDERGLRTRAVRWVGRGVTALAGFYVVMLVGGALFGVSIVPRLSLPHLGIPFLAPQAADPNPVPAPVSEVTADAPPEPAARATGTRATTATRDATAQPASLSLSSAPNGAPATVWPPSPTAPAVVRTTPAAEPLPSPSPAPTPGQRGHEVAQEHGNAKDQGWDKDKTKDTGPATDDTTDGTTAGTTDVTGDGGGGDPGGPKARSAV